MATIWRSLRNKLYVIFNPLLFVFLIRPGITHFAYLQRRNYKKGDSHLMESEKENPAHHTKSTERPGH